MYYLKSKIRSDRTIFKITSAVQTDYNMLTTITEQRVDAEILDWMASIPSSKELFINALIESEFWF